MSDQNRPSSHRCRGQRFGEIEYPLRETTRFRPRAPFVSFEERVHGNRLIYSDALLIVGDGDRRHYNADAASGYQFLCLRGFVVQCSLDPMDPLLFDVFRVIDRLGWCYTVMHVQPFCPRVVREFVSNILFDADGSLIRGVMYQFEPFVINKLMMTPSIEDSFRWEVVPLKQAITYLTRGPVSETMIKNRLRLLFAVATGRKIDFGRLVYDQVIEMARNSDWSTDLIFPNLIYQILMFQREIPMLPGDEELIGSCIRIHGTSGESSGTRGA
ncbi:hypothetical protein Bca101_017922 [Brassica carinata]